MFSANVRRLISSLFAISLPLLPAPALYAQQTGDIAIDTVRAGRYDSGKMWTFEHAPQKYFTETYGFAANEQWFERARMASLRIPGCSAAFVSRSGLIVTNHHCVSDNVVQVGKPGETLLDSGFYAPTLAQERRIRGFYADQLIAAEDVSAEVFAAGDAVAEAERAAARRAATSQIVQRLKQQHASAGDSILVQVVQLYAGGRHSAYVFRRHTDVRLVAAVELQIGFFGGDADNFTYPRYNLDFAFLRVYDSKGQPLSSPNYFTWSKAGVQEGDAVFVIGSPGPTTRMNSVAQLEFIRDVQLPAQLGRLQARWDALDAANAAEPKSPFYDIIRTQMFGLSNTLKAAGGRQAALNDALIMAKRRDAERQFAAAVDANATLKAKYGDVLTRLADVQRRKRAHAAVYSAMFGWGTASGSPVLLRRAQLLYDIQLSQRAGLADSVAAQRRRLLALGNASARAEQNDLAAVFKHWQTYFPAGDSVLLVAFGNRSHNDAAASLMAASALTDSARTAAAAQGEVTIEDPALALVRVLARRNEPFQTEWRKLIAEEAELNAQLGRARFDIYGTELAPDATSSPRIADGVVKGYPYNGTLAPPYTTFYGMYDRYYAFGKGTEWDLPKRWVPKPARLDLDTPLNFISTADTYGGNSGSPAVTRNLEIVGLNFDRNINGLARDYVYLPERGRNVMVDVRAIAESLEAVYGAKRILAEIAAGKLP